LDMQGKKPLGNGVDSETKWENTVTNPRGIQGKIGTSVNPNMIHRMGGRKIRR